MKRFTEYLKESLRLPPSLWEEETIADNSVYLDNMSKSFGDKAWFVKYVPDDISLVVDFGGGTGDFCLYVKDLLAKRGISPEFAVIDNNPAFLV